MGTATMLRQLPEWETTAALYELDPPIATADGDSAEYAVVSTLALVPGDGDAGTLVFAADETGTVLDWVPLARSVDESHEAALSRLGYRVVPR